MNYETTDKRRQSTLTDFFKKKKQRLVIIIRHDKKWRIIKMFCSVIYFNFFFDFFVVTLFCFMESSILFSESDAHAQLDDVEVLDQDQQYVDEQDDHDTERDAEWDDTEQDDGGAEEVHTICGQKPDPFIL